MSTTEPVAARWAIRVRTHGEVLAAAARESDLELHFLDLATGFTAREIEGWLHDLMGVALQTSQDDAAAKPIPALLHHALTGLLFSHAELWEHRDAPGPCTAAYVEAELGPAFGWVGSAEVEVWQGGELCDVPWIRVRDEEGREARAFQFNSERDLRIVLAWPAAEAAAASRRAEIEATWISPASRRADDRAAEAARAVDAARAAEAERAAEAARAADAARALEVARAVEAARAAEAAARRREAQTIPAAPSRRLPENQPGLAGSPSAANAPHEEEPGTVASVAQEAIDDRSEVVESTAYTEHGTDKERRTRWAGFRGLLRGLLPWKKSEPAAGEFESEPAAGDDPGAATVIGGADREPLEAGRSASPESGAAYPSHAGAPALAGEPNLAALVAAVAAANVEERAATERTMSEHTMSERAMSERTMSGRATPERATPHPTAPPQPHQTSIPQLRVESTPSPGEPLQRPGPSGLELESVTTLASKLAGKSSAPGPLPPRLPVARPMASPEAPAGPKPAPSDLASPGAPSSTPPMTPLAAPPPSSQSGLHVAPPHSSQPGIHVGPTPSGEPGLHATWPPQSSQAPPATTRFPRPARRPSAEPDPRPGLKPLPHPAEVGMRSTAPLEKVHPGAPAGPAAEPPRAVTRAEQAAEASGEAISGAPAEAQILRPPKIGRPEWPTLEPHRTKVRGPWKQKAVIGGGLAILFVFGWIVGTSHRSSGPSDRSGGAMGKVLAGFGVQAMHAEIAVSSRPPGAWIAVDGKDAARRTPATVQLVRGKHEITLSLPGLGSASFPVEVDRGQHTALDAPLWGSLEVFPANPAFPLSVSLDGRPRGFAPIEFDSLDPGLHELAFSGPRMAAWAQTVEIHIGQKTEFLARASTSPSTGVVVVRGTVTDEQGDRSAMGGQVWVDGVFRGLVPLTLELSRGPHSVRVAYRGQQAPIQVIDLPGGNQRFVDFSFGSEIDEPVLTLVSAPGRVTLERPGVVSAALTGVTPGDLREMWLHARSPDGLWRRYEMTLLKTQGSLVGTAVFPATLLDAQGTSRFYVSALTQQGDEYFTEILNVPPAGGGSAAAPPPAAPSEP